MKILVGATAAGHKGQDAARWLIHARSMRDLTPHDVEFFLAAEVQPDGQEPRLAGVEAQVRALGGTVWRFMIDDGEEAITNGTRMIRICEGRNLVTEYGIRSGAEWILFLDADISIPPETLVKLLEIGQPFCGFRVGNYGLRGEPVPGYPFPVETYQNTAGAWFLHRSVFRCFRWLWDPDDGLTDDPATYRIIHDRLGIVQYNRLDLLGQHPPLIPFEARGNDTRIRRHPLHGHPITAVMPVYFATAAHVQMTEAILNRVLQEAVARVYVLDNGATAPLDSQGSDAMKRLGAIAGDRLRVIQAPERKIYELWNLGWTSALADFGDEVLIAFLNNDIDFRPGMLEILARAVLPKEIWVAYPDPTCRVCDGVHLTGRTRSTIGSKRHGGMTGHCFLIKGGMHTKAGFPLFDARYQCWYGDDDFAFRVTRYGFQIHCVEGLPCDHINMATMHHRPDLLANREEDRRRFVAEWGEI